MGNLIEVSHLKKYFKTPTGMLHAVDDINFSIDSGKTLGVVGESGCGKSTLGRVILGLLEASDGQVIFKNEDITHAGAKRRKQLCREMQIIFQDPFASLNPRLCVTDLIAEPLIVFKEYPNRADRDTYVRKLMDTVGLTERLAYSYPHEMDGGRRQRIGVARALALNPKFIVCDEPVSALDVSIQAQILNLLQDLRDERGLTYLFITHDLSVVKHISNEILVMYLGQMVEKAASRELFKAPLHPYTKGLLSAIPIPNPDNRRKSIIMKDELTSPINPKPGCRFAARCRYACEKCHQVQPEIEEIHPEHFVACHMARKINAI